MSAMSDLVCQIQNEILRGELSFAEIARAMDVPRSWVDEAAEMLAEQDCADDYDPAYAEDAYLDASYEDRTDLGDFEY